MSVLNFPATPTVGDIWNQNNNRWRFDGQVWVSYNEAINVKFTTPTGSAILPKGTTTQRDDPAESGYIRYNTQTNQFEGYSTSWGTIGAPSIVNDTTTNATYYPAFTTTTSGSTSSVRVSSTKLNFNPSSGVLTATAFSGSGAQLTTLNATNLSTGTVSGTLGTTAGTTTNSFIRYGGTTKASGTLYGGTSAPTNATRLNYDGYLYATRFYGDGSQLTNVSGSGGAVGGSTDKIFWENDKVITANYTLTSGKNAGTFGPITINNDVIVTVPDNSVWTVV